MLYDMIIKVTFDAGDGHRRPPKVPGKSKPYGYFFPIGTLN